MAQVRAQYGLSGAGSKPNHQQKKKYFSAWDFFVLNAVIISCMKYLRQKRSHKIWSFKKKTLYKGIARISWHKCFRRTGTSTNGPKLMCPGPSEAKHHNK